MKCTACVIRVLLAVWILSIAMGSFGCYAVTVSGDRYVVKCNRLTGAVWVMSSTNPADPKWIRVEHTD